MGVIIDGEYYPGGAPKKLSISTTVAGIHESSTLSQTYRNHAHELIQPNKPDGTPNPDFIEYYPEDAKNHGLVPESEEL